MTLNVPATYYYYKYPPPPKAGLILTYWPKFKKGLVDALFCHIKCNSQWVGYFWDKSISNLRMFMFLINLEIGSFQVNLKAQKTDFALILFWVKVPGFPPKNNNVFVKCWISYIRYFLTPICIITFALWIQA